MSPTASSPVTAAGSSDILNLIASYAQALDDDRAAEVVEMFTSDGVSNIVGFARFEGLDELREGYAAMSPTAPQLHLVTNTAITMRSESEATAASDLAFFARTETGWALQMVGRYDDTLTREGDTWRFKARELTFV